jgi:hypothetical protein
LSQRQIELSYERGRPPWYRKRRVQRWAVGAAIAIALVWGVQFLQPIWRRYEYQRLQTEAANYPQTPHQILVQSSATQPYLHTPGPADKLFDKLNTAYLAAAGTTVTIGNLPSPTPVFCGAQTTSAKHRAIVQIWASVATANGEKILSLIYLLRPWRESSWLFKGQSDDSNGQGVGVDFAHMSIQLDANSSVVVFGGCSSLVDPSEIELCVLLNGKASTLKFHLIDVPPSPQPQVGIAFERSVIGQTLRPAGPVHGFSSGDVWDWPFTGK